MNCPRCRVELVGKQIRGRSTQVDACPDCNGVWLDDGELAEIVGARAMSPLPIPADAATAGNASCPRCSEPLVIFSYPGTITVIDACRGCGGTWLDAGELREIHIARSDTMTCPKCGAQQPRAAACNRCGVMVEKAMAASSRRPQASVAPPAGGSNGGLKQTLLTFVDEMLSRLWAGIRG